MNMTANANAALRLRAGPVSLTYSSGSLRYLRWGGVEVLRQIYFALRDPFWGTVPAQISGEQIDRGADTFRIRLAVRHRQGEIELAWQGTIEGDRDGSIRFSASGTAESSFRANRIGFCVLHPIEGCAGRECRVEHASGILESSSFPALISPRQPFLDVRAISHEPLPGARVHVRMEGDIFETEDHRNWTDDSFKTYSRPLTLPYPYRLDAGERISQSVTVTFEGSVPLETGVEQPVALRIRETRQASFPEVNFRRIDLHLDSPAWPVELEKAASGSAAEIAIFTRDSAAELPSLISALERIRPPVSRWLVFDAETGLTPPAAGAFRSALAGPCPGVPVGGGTNANFAELNRNRHVVEGLDFVSWPINPQVHAVDEQTLIENLRAQAATLETARTFCGGRPLVISPVTIPNPTPVAAAWLLASVKHLAIAGAHSVTYRDIPGAESVGALIQEFHPRQVVATESTNPLAADGLALRNGNRTRLLVANFLAEDQEILVDGVPRRLGPHAIAAIDGVIGK